MCDEVVDAGALGFVGRGFDTVVKPAFELELRDTPCESCGQCVSVCPTGALQERTRFKKFTPLKTKKTDSICGMCAVGCSMCIESYGSLLVKTTPAIGRGMNDGVMCGCGRFGINYVQKERRITAPMLRKNGRLTYVSWHDAFVYTAKKMETLKLRGEKTSISIGQNYCLEDAGAIVNLAKLFGSETFSFMGRENGLNKVLGYDGSPNALEEVLGCDKIIMFGTSMLRNTVVLSKLRRAVKQGTPVTVVTNESDKREYNLRCKIIKTPGTTAIIKQIIKALVELGCEPKNADGFEELKESLAETKIGKEARAIAESYASAKKAMILYAIGDLSVAAATGLGNMAVVGGHIGSPRSGIYMLRQMSGSQTLADLGVIAGHDTEKGSKGLMIFGEDPEILSSEHELLVVQDTHMTATVKKADVVFPLAVYPEIEGTFINTERRLQHSGKAVPPPMEYRTSQIAQKIAEILESVAPEGNAHELYPNKADSECWPAPVLFVDGFGFDDKRAKLQAMEETALFEPLPNTCHLMNVAVSGLPKPKKTQGRI